MGNHVHGIAQQAAGFFRIDLSEKFQQHRQIIGQFVAVEREAFAFVFFEQIHHRHASAAIFAVNVLEDIHGVAAVAVEGVDISLLQLNQAAAAQIIEKALQRRFLCGRQRPLP